ncbi:MAG: hypothetical protein KGI50_06950 [Patescibacteria group bacterium]|nr:hypothetical protein [Patescibacteria group bacterium]MDE2439350.1 hypothetical protein [Patescibacteria group bacterium]
MNFETTLELYSGGPGSGRKPEGGSTDPIWTSGWVKKDGSFIPLGHGHSHADEAVIHNLSRGENSGAVVRKAILAKNIRITGYGARRGMPLTGEVNIEANDLHDADTKNRINDILSRLPQGTSSVFVEDLNGKYKSFSSPEDFRASTIKAHDPINLPKRPRKIEVPDDGFPTPRPTWKTLQKENYKSAMKKKYPKFPFLTTPGTQPLQPIQGAFGKKEVLQLPKGLTKKEAWKLACKKAKYDFRGAKYNPETGKMILCSNINDVIIDEVRAQASSPKKGIAVLMDQMIGIGPGIHWPRGMK